MCGIVGYIGEKDATKLLIESLKKLEYRGYDSSGIGVIDKNTGKIELRKSVGKINELENLIKKNPPPNTTCGISHTRWATHGAPTKKNAHPHISCSRRIAIVHNGIIENYEEIKRELIKKKHKFSSETDTETIVHLIEENYTDNLLFAVIKTIKKLKGSFALGIISKDNPNTIIAARRCSPLIIGIGENENYIASDVPAILEETKKIVYLKDDEIALLTKDNVELFSSNGEKKEYKINTVTFNIDAVKKQGYAHFMLKEIHEQPNVIKQLLNIHIKNDTVQLRCNKITRNWLKSTKNIFIIACGTAYHAGMVGKYIIEKIASIPVTVDVSSEFRYRNPIIPKNTLAIAISQSGETADTLAAVKEAKSKGAKTISICNVLGSSLTRQVDDNLYTHAGPEIGVASTKAYTAQLCMLYLLALQLSQDNSSLSNTEIKNIIQKLKQIPDNYTSILHNKKTIATIAKKNSHFGCFLFLGRNINYPSALEGALKLKEISYIPAEGYAAGEMKHGPIALIDEYRAVVCINPQSETYEKMISNMQEIRARKGKIIAIATHSDTMIKKHANQVIYIPQTHNILTPLLTALPLQLIAYYIAVKLGCDVDQPRNLAKSVTVE